ncbi:MULTISPECIES: hypothetical protein [unclassified Mycolicibacterium]|uniref:hypothetical protein n=1 Tax=unclassified Mycolicibacterium TaxID=2636767 RepID=UPI001F4C1F41|nr:hypothetical protein [Mycolicibacterium sp. YH-1]UNB55328.1 hypothetical protein L0M16_13990 [Mycolicibacterium sp. YH-1]
MPRAAIGRESAAPGNASRRRRPREETRALFLKAGTRVAINRTAEPTARDQNLLAHIRVTDVLGEINAGEAAQLTTGAFYQIWPSQAEFQRELLTHIMDQIAVPGGEEITALVFNLVAERVDSDEIFRRLADEDFRLTRESPELFLAIGLGALAPADLVRDAQRDANEQYVASLGRVLNGLLAYARRQLRPGRTIEDLIWAIEALSVGYLLRSRTDPDVPERADSEGWSARATAFLGMVEAFTEPVGA